MTVTLVEKMLYDNAQLLTSSLELAKLFPVSDPVHETLLKTASSIITYVSCDLRSPEGAFYSAEDADSLPTHDSTVKKEGAFYAWTVQELDEILGLDSEMFKYHFGAQLSGNCDPQHDIQGELTGQVRCDILTTSIFRRSKTRKIRTFCSRRIQRKKRRRNSKSRQVMWPRFSKLVWRSSRSTVTRTVLVHI